MATIEYDEDGLPCLVLDMPICPTSAHDSLALDAAIARLCNALPDSPEERAAEQEIQTIRARQIAAQG